MEIQVCPAQILPNNFLSFKILVRSVLDYACLIGNNLSVNRLHELEIIQNNSLIFKFSQADRVPIKEL